MNSITTTPLRQKSQNGINSTQRHNRANTSGQYTPKQHKTHSGSPGCVPKILLTVTSLAIYCKLRIFRA